MHGSSDDPWIVTTPRRRTDLEMKARATAERLGVRFISRGADPFHIIFERTGAHAAIVETDEHPVIQTAAGSFFFHENTAGLRTSHNGETDALLRALDPQADDHVLDATLGIACDALVIATSLESGRLLGLESNPLIADVVARGLVEYSFKKKHLKAAAEHIDVLRADHSEFLKNRAENEFDLVYFDPMFSETVTASSSMQRIREIADKTPLSGETLREAGRVARRRIVVKGRRGCFEPIEFDRIIPSGKSIFYGIIDV